MKAKLFAILLPACLIASCSSDTINTGMGGGAEGFAGLVVGDEPLAVQAGADMLSAGGSAADAAAATYFALAVTYPVAAGLGGGGICLVRDPRNGLVESIDFLPRNVRSGGPFAVPGNVRGLALVHSLYGREPWQSVVARGERLAALGFPMSRALAERVADSANIVRLDAELAKMFMDESGQMHREGDMLRNPDLSTSLSAIRTNGSGALYSGKLTDALMAYAAQQNGPIAADELANYAPSRAKARLVMINGEAVFLPPERTGAGKLATGVFASFASSPEAISPAAVATAVKQALNTYGVGALPNDLGATGFAAVDKDGQAVACAVTMSGPFGSGRTAEASGITLASAPGASNAGLSVAFLTPVIAAESDSGPLTLSGAGAGGPDATAAILYEAAARSRHEAITPQAGAGPRLSNNVIACEAGACKAIPSPGNHGMGAVAGGE